MTESKSKLELAAEISHLIDICSDYELEYKFAQAFAELTDRPETEVLGMIRGQARINLEDLAGARKYSMATRQAVESVWAWYSAAENSRKYVEESLVRVVAGHYPAWVWATLVGLGDAKLAESQPVAPVTVGPTAVEQTAAERVIAQLEMDPSAGMDGESVYIYGNVQVEDWEQATGVAVKKKKRG